MESGEKVFQRLLADLERLRRRALLVDMAAGLLLALAVGLLAALLWVGIEALTFIRADMGLAMESACSRGWQWSDG